MDEMKSSEQIGRSINELTEKMLDTADLNESIRLAEQIRILTEAYDNAVRSEQSRETTKKSRMEWIKNLIPTAVTGVLAFAGTVVAKIIETKSAERRTAVDCDTVKMLHDQAIAFTANGETTKLITDPSAKDMMKERPGRYSR